MQDPRPAKTRIKSRGVERLVGFATQTPSRQRRLSLAGGHAPNEVFGRACDFVWFMAVANVWEPQAGREQ
jgi:hypothetical protein